MKTPTFSEQPIKKNLWKSHGLLWDTYQYSLGVDISPTPFCPVDNCRARLQMKDSRSWFCVNCERKYPLPANKEAAEVEREVNLKWQGALRKDYEIISLDLPTGSLAVEDKDEDFWVKVKVGQRGGNRMMIVYVGETVGKGQTKKDYAQLFVDLDDEQIRFDRNNKNPMGLLSKLEGEFARSTTVIKTRDGNTP